MRVRCLSNKKNDLSTPWRGTFGIGSSDNLSTDLVLGKEYVVYALWFLDGIPGFYLHGEHFSRYPILYPAELFQITDSHPSKYWVIAFWPALPRHKIGPTVFLGPQEWASDRDLYGQIVDGDLSAASMWRRFTQLLDNEASDSNVGVLKPTPDPSL
jgi:hypothetical protein